jgi:hypothetical protein
LWLTTAQQALADLTIGGKAVSVSYDGKSVTYVAADRMVLVQWIGELQAQLGLVRRERRALTPYF